ncbi:hypothetical protein FO519_001609 [Halicephalobus sp. NKZ332]|nr:hypothetical protein FO519_001609 [Halicephalobus sp. NKZ332]
MREILELPIAVIVIVDEFTKFANYQLAQDSLSCYCQHYNYPLIRVSLDQEPDLVSRCPQKDFMFQRHCVFREMMLRNPKYHYFYFLDADMGIVNPNHLLEDYINPDADIVFYERIFNFEFMAGSYIVKNTQFGRYFLRDWYSYEDKIPNSFHGTDNAAIHQVFLERFKPEKANACRPTWEASQDWDGVWKYVACVRFNLGMNNTNFGRIEVRQKGTDRVWVRDGWLTGSRWGPRDFIFHGWQNSRLDINRFARWANPFVPSGSGTGFEMNKCSTKMAMLNWAYKDTFLLSNQEVKETLQKEIENVKREFDRITGSM